MLVSTVELAWRARKAGELGIRGTEGIGLDCSNLPGYTDAGRMSDGLGTDFGSRAPFVENAVYPYFKKS